MVFNFNAAVFVGFFFVLFVCCVLFVRCEREQVVVEASEIVCDYF